MRQACRSKRRTFEMKSFLSPKKVTPRDCSPERRSRLNQRVWRTNRVINLTRKSGLPQFRCLPSAGGRFSSEPLRYVLNVPGVSEEVNHSFLSWAVGYINQQLKDARCESLTESSEISGASLCGSFAGSQRTTGLSTCVTTMNMASASALSNGSSSTLGK